MVEQTTMESLLHKPVAEKYSSSDISIMCFTDDKISHIMTMSTCSNQEERCCVKLCCTDLIFYAKVIGADTAVAVYPRLYLRCFQQVIALGNSAYDSIVLGCMFTKYWPLFTLLWDCIVNFKLNGILSIHCTLSVSPCHLPLITIRVCDVLSPVALCGTRC